MLSYELLSLNICRLRRQSIKWHPNHINPICRGIWYAYLWNMLYYG